MAQIGNYDFALQLSRRVAAGAGGNQFLSPASVSLVLAMCYSGAGGATRSELRDRLFGRDAGDEHVRRWARRVLAEAADDAERGDAFRLRFANRLYAAAGFRVRDAYRSALEADFRSDVITADFAAQGPKVTQEVNDWVAQVTNDRIKNLVPPGTLNADTALLLVNALYFKGVWDDEFSVERTHRRDFQSTAQRTVQVDMMRMRERLHYGEADGAQVLSLAYGRSTAAMHIILPRERHGLRALVDGLDGVKLNRLLGAVQKREVEIEIPKFKMEQSFKLNDALKSLGVEKAFGDSADFSAMIEPTSRRIKISDVYHKAFIEVDEKGTEAAAATYVKMVPMMAHMPDPDPPKFIADHPFLFLLTVGESADDRAILFLGQFHGPA